MTQLNRRQFGALLLAGSQARNVLGAVPDISRVIAESMQRRGIPSAAAIAISATKTLYSAGFGTRDADSDIAINGDTIFAIASMTKPVTSVAAMQLVERGLVSLDEPVSRHLPELANMQVLNGFNLAGEPVLRPARTPITLRHLLTHTSGMCYPTWHEQMNRYTQVAGAIPPTGVAPLVPLMFEPGTRWQYGYSTDWAGRLVEAISRVNLAEYFEENILAPLGMADTSFDVPAEKFERLIGRYQRQPNGSFTPVQRAQPGVAQDYNGGGGLYSTANDYAKFMRMILRYGRGPGRTEILKARTVEEMEKNQIGNLMAGKMQTFQPNLSSDVDTQPGHPNRWGLGFLINPEPHEGGRLGGSLAWAGIYNTYFWIDPEHQMAGAIMMQYLPFFDEEAVGLLDDFERAVYANY